MKKTFIILSLMALGMMAHAQMTYRVIYVPGDGERQFGFSLSPTFCSQHLGVDFNYNNAGTAVSADADGMLTNLLGIGAGLFYGYETIGNTVEWGNYTSLFYGINPFSGKVSLTRNGSVEEHDISYFSHHIQLHFNPFLAYRINDQFSVSAGLGFNLSPQLPGKVKMDGQSLSNGSDDAETSWLLNILNIYVDANVGAKYWFSDDMFVGLRVQYSFFNVFHLLESVMGGEDADSVNDVLEGINGVVDIDLDKNTSQSMILPKNAIQAVFSIGYAW